MSAPTLCDECNGTGRRGLIGGVKAYRTCEACQGTGRVTDKPAAPEEPVKDPRLRHTLAEGKRRQKHGGAR